MLIKFFARGIGGGSGPVDYVISPDRAGREAMPPEVLRGDADRTRDLIDCVERKWQYTSGVISFAREDAPTAAQQERVMDEFEAAAFAGLAPDQYDILWTRHAHTEGGRVELHFVVPRVELLTGKALNIAPPGWENHFDPLRDALNFEHGWARPDDPDRAREQLLVQERPDRAESREAITAFLTGRIEAGEITNRAGIVQGLVEAGFEMNREGKDYVSVRDPESGAKFRLKGAIYELGWTADKQLDRALAPENGDRTPEHRGIDPERAADARQKLERSIDRRAVFNAERYPRPDDRVREADVPEAGQHRDQDWADRGGAEALAAVERSRGAGVERFNTDWALGIVRLAERGTAEPANAERARTADPGLAETANGRREIHDDQQRPVSGFAEGRGAGMDVRRPEVHQTGEIEDDGAIDAARARAFESFWGHRSAGPELGKKLADADREFSENWQRGREAERQCECERQQELDAELERIRTPGERYREWFSDLGDRVRDAAGQIGSLAEIGQRSAQLFERVTERIQHAAQRFGEITGFLDRRVEEIDQERERQVERNDRGFDRGR